MTLYSLKPRFQALLRPLTTLLHAIGITANQVTIAAGVGSVALGVVLAMYGPANPVLFVLLPFWMFIRMALNAIDGMLAREFGHASTLGAYLNEMCDVVSDASLVLPFALIAPCSPILVVILVLLAIMSEYAGVLGCMIGADRRYDGPSGKSDRALVFGALGTWLGVVGTLPSWTNFLLGAVALLLGVTIVNRTRKALQTAKVEPAETPTQP